MSTVELLERVAEPATAVQAKRRKRLPNLRRWISPVALVVLWQVSSATGLLSPDKLSSPWTVLRAGIDTARSGELGEAFAVSITRVGIGFAFGAAVALVLGIVTGLSKWGDALIDPPVQMLRTLPFLGLIPLLILWFGIGEEPKIVLVALGVAWLALIVGETVDADAGLGYLINNAREFLRTDVIVVGLVVYAVLGLVTDALVRLLERRALRWRKGVTVRGLTKRFGDREVLSGLDLDIAPGEFVALLGRSGSGKSTLPRVLAGLNSEVDGQFSVHGAVSVAFQQPRLLPWRKVWRNVVLGLRGRGADRALAERALAEVRLGDHADAWPRTLSGGEAQRLSLARALVREPDLLLLLDEPFGALDALTRLAMHSLVADLWARHQPSVLLVTHDVDEALLLADRVLILDRGVIVAEHVLTHADRAGTTTSWTCGPAC